MVSAELGQKRRCFSCGMKFYDFNKSPITCPECGSEFDPENLLKSRRGKSAVKATVVKPDAAAEDDLEDESETKDDEFDESDDVADDEICRLMMKHSFLLQVRTVMRLRLILKAAS